MNQIATGDHEPPFEIIIIDEWWIPAGKWAEVAVYDPLRAAVLLRAVEREMAARFDRARTEQIDADELAPLVVCIDNVNTLADAWHRIATDGGCHDRAILAASDPKAAVNALITRGHDAALTVLLSAPTAPVPHFLREEFHRRMRLGDTSPQAAAALWGERPAAVAGTAPASVPRARSESHRPASVTIPVWRTPAAPTRTLVAYPVSADEQPTLASSELLEFIERL